MKQLLLAGVALSLLLVACDETTPVDPDPLPDAQTMNFQTGARYSYRSYSTDPNSGEKVDATERNRELALVGTNLSLRGETGVALYLDSIFGIGGNFEVLDSLLLRQESGSNDVYRFAPLLPEFDLGGIADVDLGATWMHEARLGATSASWFVASVSDTIPYTIPQSPVTSKGIVVEVTDSAVASSVESVTIDGTSYSTTRTLHSLRLSFSYSYEVPVIGGFSSVEFASVALSRSIWFSADLGAIVREEREGKVIDANLAVPGSTIDTDLSIPIPGFYLEMTGVN